MKKIMSGLLIGVLLTGVVIYLAEDFIIKADFDLICKVMIEGSEDQTMDPAEKAEFMARSISEGIWHPKTIQTIQALSATDPASKREMLLESANRIGYKDWDCPLLHE